MIIDLSEHAKFRITGTDRLHYLNGQLTNDLRRLAPDHAIYTCALTLKGKLAADLHIAADANLFWIDAAASVRESLAIRLKHYVIADDVVIEDVTEDYSLLHFFDEVPPQIDGAIKTVNDRFRTTGLDLWFPRSATEGHLPGVSIATAEEVEQLRIERGIPIWGAELSKEVIPMEAGLDESAISFTKGCYLGQEVISRIKSIGHVNRYLRGLKLIKGISLRVGDQLFSSKSPEKSLGRITSVTQCSKGSWLALGYVQRGVDQPGTVLEVHHGDSSDSVGSVEVKSLPFTSI